MQSLQDIPDVTTLTASRAMLLSNILTALSSSSGTAFPTVNLQVGMLCHRTDQNKIYSLKEITPVWVMLIDLSALPIPNLSTLAAATNLNTVITSGFYRCGAMTNGPTGLSNGQLIVMHGGGDTISQIYCDHASGNTYVRAGNPIDVGGAGIWSAWSKQWSETNDGASSGLDADTVDGFQTSTATTANTIPVRDVDGKLPGDILGNAASATNANTAAAIADGSVSTALKIANNIITWAKHANMNTGKLIGRATAGAGIPEEITLGTGLSFAGMTLNAAVPPVTSVGGYGNAVTAAQVAAAATAGYGYAPANGAYYVPNNSSTAIGLSGWAIKTTTPILYEYLGGANLFIFASLYDGNLASLASGAWRVMQIGGTMPAYGTAVLVQRVS